MSGSVDIVPAGRARYLGVGLCLCRNFRTVCRARSSFNRCARITANSLRGQITMRPAWAPCWRWPNDCAAHRCKTLKYGWLAAAVTRPAAAACVPCCASMPTELNEAWFIGFEGVGVGDRLIYLAREGWLRRSVHPAIRDSDRAHGSTPIPIRRSKPARPRETTVVAAATWRGYKSVCLSVYDERNDIPYADNLRRHRRASAIARVGRCAGIRLAVVAADRSGLNTGQERSSSISCAC